MPAPTEPPSRRKTADPSDGLGVLFEFIPQGAQPAAAWAANPYAVRNPATLTVHVPPNLTPPTDGRVAGPLQQGGSRRLTQGEIALAKTMFGDSIDYNSVEIKRYGQNFAQKDNETISLWGNIYFQPNSKIIETISPLLR